MGQPNPKPNRVTLTVGGKPLILFCKPAEMAPYVGTVTPDLGSLMVTHNETVKTHTRRRYKGGPAITVQSHVRVRTSGDAERPSTLPGNNAWLEKPGPTPGSKMVQQFTYVGSFKTLKAWVKTVAAADLTLRSPWGEPFKIEEGTP